jgi:hypothetical protein
MQTFQAFRNPDDLGLVICGGFIKIYYIFREFNKLLHQWHINLGCIMLVR